MCYYLSMEIVSMEIKNYFHHEEETSMVNTVYMNSRIRKRNQGYQVTTIY